MANINAEKIDILIRPLEKREEAEICATIMAGSDPWKTLNMSYEELLRSFDDASSEFYVAVAENKVAGFVSIQMNGQLTGYIKRIAVSSELRGIGVGKKLMSFAEERIFSEKANVFLCVTSFNVKAKELYLNLGYEIIGELKDFLVEGYSEIIMRKTKGPIFGYGKNPVNKV